MDAISRSTAAFTPTPSRRPAPDPPPEPVDVRAELEQCLVRPWLPPSEPMKALGTPQDDDAKRAFATLKDVERYGLWGEGETPAVVVQDMAFLRTLLPEGASLADAAEGYRVLFDIEKTQHTDPTPHARRALQVVAPSLRPGESMKDAAQAYAELFRYVVRHDINPSENAREAYQRVGEHLVESQSRVTAAQVYARNPQTYAKRQAEERAAWEARQAEVRRVAEAVSREPAPVAPIEQHEDWIIVGSVKVPRRGH